MATLRTDNHRVRRVKLLPLLQLVVMHSAQVIVGIVLATDSPCAVLVCPA